MSKKLTTLVFLFLSISLYAQNGRTISPFDDNWKFFKGDATGAEQTSFDASTWTDVKLPHDWSIYGPYDRNNTTGSGGGYLPSDIGWYRNSFSLTNKDAGKKFSIEFDGIMANSDVWINGHHLGKRPSGYVSLSYDLTPYLKFDGVNLIAVRADNSIQPASRWYTGAGIYRHVRLVSTNPIHVDHWGSFITTSNATAQNAKVQIQTTIVNESSSSETITVRNSLMDPNGKEIASTQTSKKINAGKKETISQTTEIKKPLLWDVDNPQLYKAVSTIVVKKQNVDEVSNSFGI